MSLHKDCQKLPSASAGPVGGRVAMWLRREYPRSTAKELARTFGCSHHTTARWLRGERPQNQHFDQMVRRWGTAFLNHCYGLAEPWSEAAMEQELDDLRARLDRLEGRAL